MVRSAFQAAVYLSSDPSFVLARLNEIRFDLQTRDIQAYFASAFVGCITADGRELAYASGKTPRS
jgi:serine phosphatase RsbU (regulator of sigma subunit)